MFFYFLLRQFHLTTEVLFLGGKNNLIYEFFLPFRNLHRVVIGTNTVHFLCATRCFEVVSSSRSLSSPFIAQMFDIPWSLHSQVYFQLPEPIAFFNACFAAHHCRISIFIIQIFQWSLQVKWHWIYTKIMLVKKCWKSSKHQICHFSNPFLGKLNHGSHFQKNLRNPNCWNSECGTS